MGRNAHSMMKMDFRCFFDRVDSHSEEITDVSGNGNESNVWIIYRRRRVQRHLARRRRLPSQYSAVNLFASSQGSFRYGLFSQSIVDSCSHFCNVARTARICDAKVFASAIKFMYIWNLREMSNLFRGLMWVVSGSFINATEFGRLWLHECTAFTETE